MKERFAELTSYAASILPQTTAFRYSIKLVFTRCQLDRQTDWSSGLQKLDPKNYSNSLL